jgi:hypothetical protein
MARARKRNSTGTNARPISPLTEVELDAHRQRIRREIEAEWTRVDALVGSNPSLQYLHDNFADGGEPVYALMAIDLCAISGWPIPSWAARVFVSAFHAWVGGKVRSLDRAFEVRPPKTDRHEELAVKIFLAVERRQDSGASVGQGLFEEVARELGVSSWSQCRKLYYKRKHVLDEWFKAISQNSP